MRFAPRRGYPLVHDISPTIYIHNTYVKASSAKWDSYAVATLGRDCQQLRKFFFKQYLYSSNDIKADILHSHNIFV